MKRRLITATVIALSALTIMFNSCKEDDESFPFPSEQVELLLPDGAVVDTLVDRDIFIQSSETDYSIIVMYGTDPDDLTKSLNKENNVLQPGKYYWHVRVADTQKKIDSEYSETRIFYVPEKMKIVVETDNGENENAIVLRWKGLDRSKFSNIKVQMKPTKECNFAGKTFDVPDGQDSLYIKWTDNMDVPYMFNDFDDLHGVNYEPVIYNFTFLADVAVDDKVCQTYSVGGKEIFLNNKMHIRDHEYNVYRVVEVGDQIWMADDLRCTSYIDENGDTIQMKLNEDYVVSELPSGAKGILYSNLFMFNANDSDVHLKEMGPKEFHYAYDEDWNQLEKVFGIDAELPKLSGIIGTTTYTQGAAFPIENGNLNLKSVADSLYVDSPVINMWQEFASTSDWVDDNGNQVFKTASIFNIKPFGFGGIDDSVQFYYQGYGALYYSRPKRIRTFFSLKTGIGHYGFTPDLVDAHKYANICYPVRFVKNITK